MNSLDALATVAKEGAGIVRVPSWQVEADLAAGRRPPGSTAGRLRAGASSIASDVSTVAAGFAEDHGLR
jgi:hypothetical protein